MVATTGYNAGIETNSTQMSYAVETAFCGGNVNTPTAPAVAFKALRYVSENMSGSKNRQRPNEINITREATQAVTVSEQAAGTLNGALSYTTYDDLFASGVGNQWGTPVSIAGATGDIILAGSGPTYTLTAGAGKWAGITAGMWIRLLGFTLSGGVNNNIYKVVSTTSTVLTLNAPFNSPVAETPAGSAAQVRALQMGNGTTFTSLFLQQQLSSALFLRYPGSYVSGFTVQGSVGNFVQSNFNIIATQELNSITNASTGGVVAAPTGSVFNCVGNFSGITWNNALVAATIDQFTITANNAGAAAQYGLGSAAAAGMLSGTFECNGTFRLFFKDFTLYQNFKSETLGTLSIAMKDGSGNAYVFTLPNATLMNPQVSAGGPGQAVMAQFTIEGNPQAAGGTLLIDRLINV